MSNIKTGADRMPYDLSHLVFVAGQVGRLITILITPVIAGKCFYLSVVVTLRLFQFRRRLTMKSTGDIFTFYVSHPQAILLLATSTRTIGRKLLTIIHVAVALPTTNHDTAAGCIQASVLEDRDYRAGDKLSNVKHEPPPPSGGPYTNGDDKDWDKT